MDAMKEALKRKMMEHQSGKKPNLEIAIGIPKPDKEYADSNEEGDPLLDEKRLKEENDLAPESDEDEMGEASQMGQLVNHEKGEDDMLRQILAALSDRSMPGRESNGLAERAAMGAKAKLNGMRKV
jgi:hypothetical protein